jgi:acyl-CoA synthetase (AMP-forming)/AMP-acid ligase II
MPLTQYAAELADKPAYLMSAPEASLTFGELEEQSNRIAHLFRQRGLRPGDHVAVLFGNQLEIFPVVWAAQRSGLYYTPVNWHLTPDEAAYVVDNCEARVLVSDASLEELASRCVASAPQVEFRFVVGGDVEGVERLEDAVADLPTTPIADELEGASMLYSSGTTGRPKGVLPGLPPTAFGDPDSARNLLAQLWGFDADTVLVSPGPIYHAAPLAFSMAVTRAGGTVVQMPRFDAADLLRVIERYRVTHFQAVPTMFVRMLKLSEEERTRHDLSSLQKVVHAAAPCPVPVKEQMIEWLGPVIWEYYAGSEGSGTTIIDSPTWLTHRGSVGRAAFGVVHISEDGVHELPPGEVGTIWFSDGLTFEYYKDPAKTRSVYSPVGWSTLGDMGYVDEDGFLFIADRRTDLIISGGVNIYPREVEDAFALHPGVVDVGVIGLPDEEMGQRVHAVVQLTDPSAAGPELADELVAFVRERIASFKAPRSIEFRESLPRLPSGKMLRRKLLEDARQQPLHVPSPARSPEAAGQRVR